MSIQNSTLHYHFPLVTGTDRPIFSDYNATMELLDEQLYSAVSNVAVFAGQIAALQETSGEHTTELAELDTFKTEQEGINSANADRFLAINQTLNNQAVTNNNKFNSVSIADAYDATRTYSVGDVVTYNGDRYRCITAVTTGEPFDADKWQGEDVQAVLSQLNSKLAGKSYSVTTDGVKTRAELLNQLNALRVAGGDSLRPQSILAFGGTVLHHTGNVFTCVVRADTNEVGIAEITLSNDSKYLSTILTSGSVVTTDGGSTVPTAGAKITLYI